MTLILDASTFDTNNELLQNHTAILAIKNFERQTIRDRVALRRKGESNTLKRSTPYPGRICRLGMSDSKFSNEHSKTGCIVDCFSPYLGILCGETFYYNNYESVIRKTEKDEKCFSDIYTKRVHAFDFHSHSGDILVSSSGFDVIHRLDKELNLISKYSIWELVPGIAYKDGRRYSLTDFECPTSDSSILHLIDPTSNDYRDGLGIGDSPFYVNGASFSHHDKVLFTGYNSNLLFVTDFKNTEQYGLNLRSPHCFMSLAKEWNNAEYCVLDSGHGRVLFLDSHFSAVYILKLSTLPKNTNKYGNEEWMQFLHIAENGIIVIVDQIRHSIHILDIEKRERRSITYPRSWSIHGLFTIPTDHNATVIGIF